jgi:hypothetical protein
MRVPAWSLRGGLGLSGGHRAGLLMEEGHEYLQINYGKAQVVNASAKGADPETTFRQEGANFVIDAGKDGATKVTVLSGSVVAENAARKEKGVIQAGETMEVVRGKPFGKCPKFVMAKPSIWWALATTRKSCPMPGWL